MKYKDFGLGVLATMLLAGATVMFLVSEGSLAESKSSGGVSAPVSPALSAQIRQQASAHFQRTSADGAERPEGAEKSRWVF